MLWHQIIVYLRSWLLQPGFVGKVRWRSIVGGDKHSNRTIILPLWSMVTNSSAHSALATAHCFDFAGRRCRPSFFRRAVSDSRALTSPLQLLLWVRQCLLSSPCILHRCIEIVLEGRLVRLCVGCGAYEAPCGARTALGRFSSWCPWAITSGLLAASRTFRWPPSSTP